jgi:hypothetical protein
LPAAEEFFKPKSILGRESLQIIKKRRLCGGLPAAFPMQARA